MNCLKLSIICFFLFAVSYLTGSFVDKRAIGDNQDEFYFESGGIAYNTYRETASVTKKKSGFYKGQINIPSRVIYKGDTLVVAVIDERAFNGATKITAVNIPESVLTISRTAFDQAANLTSITVNPANENYRTSGGILYEGADIFKCPEGIVSVVLNNINMLREVDFTNCGKIESLTVPATVNKIEWRAISDLKTLIAISVDQDNKHYSSFDGALYSKKNDTLKFCPRAKKTIELYRQMNTIGAAAFESCANLKTIAIPNSVTAIENTAFQACTSLKHINLPNGIKKIAHQTFFLCPELEQLEIPESVTEIENVAFQHCWKLRSITIPAAVKSIYRNPFADCYSLEKMDVAASNRNYVSVDGVLYSKNTDTLISYPCGNRNKTFRIPGSVTHIREWSFYYNHYLETVTIPRSVKSIDWYVFFDCKRLKNIRCESGVPPKLAVNTELPPKKITVYVPKASVGDYQTAPMWIFYRIKPLK
jgi:hypothetical protein